MWVGGVSALLKVTSSQEFPQNSYFENIQNTYFLSVSLLSYSSNSMYLTYAKELLKHRKTEWIKKKRTSYKE